MGLIGKKNQDFWKPKRCTTIAWALYTPCGSSSLKVSSSSTWSKQLKCVLCYPLALIVGVKRRIITYKIVNEIFALWKHLKTNHQQAWTRKKMGVNEISELKTRCDPNPSILCIFFGSVVFYCNDDHHKK
jgi:hypothetical protein